MKRRIYGRGRKTVELPFLMSCILFLLDRRYWILGLRAPVAGTRFDVVARHGGGHDHLILVEAKYRGDGRPVRPHEVQRFFDELESVRAKMVERRLYGVFLTNTEFSENALDLARTYRIRCYPNVPLHFRLAEGEAPEGRRGS